MNKILITGALGYIGSTLAVELSNYGYEVVMLDNIFKNNISTLNSVRSLSFKQPEFHLVDIRDKPVLKTIFKKYEFDTVIHLAALTSIPESLIKPNIYRDINLEGSKTIIDLCEEFKIPNFIFASSASIYSPSKVKPLGEYLKPTKFFNPYAYYKYQIEEYLKSSSFNVVCFRYFNPIGNHYSLELGNRTNTSSLMYNLNRCALDTSKTLTLSSNCIRDYIHIEDLIRAHIDVLRIKPEGFNIYNLGRGIPVTTLELVETYIETNNIKNIKIKEAQKRVGDLVYSVADITKARRELNFHPFRNLKDMCQSSYSYACQNPKIYRRV